VFCQDFKDWSGIPWLDSSKEDENPDVRGGTMLKEHHQKMEPANRKVANGTIDLGSYKLHYAYLSQQGHNPSRPDFVNQDDCIVIEHFESEVCFWVFGFLGFRVSACPTPRVSGLGSRVSGLGLGSWV
jgi:hypothetical protein